MEHTDLKRFTREQNVNKIGLTVSEKRLHGNYNIHWHEFYEIEYITEGSGEYVIDGKKYPICPGMLFLMTPLNFHSVKADNCRGFNLMFSEQLCEGEFLARLLQCAHGKAILFPFEDRSFLKALMTELTFAKSEAYVSALLNSILGKILTKEDSAMEKITPVSKGVVYLLQNFRKNPTLAETAAHAGFTPTYFSMLFKKEMGESFKQYVNRLRFDYAKKLAIHSNLSVLQICYESGFENYPNFIRRFKSRFGIPPGELKQSVAQSDDKTR
jgi:AraC-like DNA-binding protein